MTSEPSSESQNYSRSTPQLSFEVNLEDNEDEPEKVDTTTKFKKGGGTLWSKEEDILLISAWLNVSMDAIVGTGQKVDTFWSKIEQYIFDAQNQGDPTFKWPMKRTSGMCKTRWNKKINHSVQKFRTYFTAILRRNQSGWKEADHLKAAHKMYKKLIGKECTVEHCWRELRDQEKWKNHVCIKVNEDGQTEVKVAIPTSTRPLGRDSTKRKVKSKVDSSTIDISIEGRERVDALRKSRVARDGHLKRLVELKEEKMLHRRSSYEKEEERKDIEVFLKLKEYERSIIDTDLSDKSDAQKQWYNEEIAQIMTRRKRY